MIDLAPLWDFDRPDVSEQRFRAAMPAAQGDDVLVLQTQIARTFGLRRDFARAREVLKSIEPAMVNAGAEARTRYWLELGRTYASGMHATEALTADALAAARSAYAKALEVAREGRLDALAIDAIHMFAFVDTAPADQLKWGREALAVSLASSQPAARRWEGSIRHNIGYALHQLGRHEEALSEFQQALRLREAAGSAQSIRVAKWMIAWTLRSLQRSDEALAMQLELEREFDAAGAPDPYVFEELEHLYRAAGDAGRAGHYAKRREAAKK
jgi:tetratricopeptide (TPR) repeat protein